jgi:hypothetical protein
MGFLRTFFLLLGTMSGTLSEAAAEEASSSKSVLQTEPDRPVGFGYKVNWFAIRTTDGAAVGRILGLTNLQRANWASGIAFAYEVPERNAKEAKVFVASPIKGWTFVVGSGLPYPVDVSSREDELRLGRDFRRYFFQLASHFDEVQFFGTYRVVGFDAWARARNGRVERIFSFMDGEVLANEGMQSSEEARLGFINLGERTPGEATAFLIEKLSSDNKSPHSQERGPLPNEQDTIDLASAWSLDPTQLEATMEVRDIGFVGLLSYNKSH